MRTDGIALRSAWVFSDPRASIMSENGREKAPSNILRNSAIRVHAYSEAKPRCIVYTGRLALTDGTFAKGVPGKAQASASRPSK